MAQMVDEYAFLRSQYEEIILHSDFLLRTSADPKILTKAKESKLRAEQELARLNRYHQPIRAHA